MNTVQGLLDKIRTELLAPLITLLFVLATVIFLWGVIQYVIGSQGNEQKLQQGRRAMIWGIVGLFIMSAAWGIVTILCNFFDGCPRVIP